MQDPEALEIETGSTPTASVIWLHGLGADAHDFEPIVPALTPSGTRALRFIFPNAPVRPVTINGGYRMRAWYDIAGIDRDSAQDETGIRESDALIKGLIARENERGIASRHIVVAGFSQGGVMAVFSATRYPERLAGIIGLSCYMGLASTFEAERSAANAHTPIFMGHGTQDGVVNFALGNDTQKLLKSSGYEVEWHSYAMAHSVSPQEIADVADFLHRALRRSRDEP
jgi:phospholipase/carboxylesterase